MGRRKKETLRLKAGMVYKVDRRYNGFEFYRKVHSRQHSRNDSLENVVSFEILSSPVVTTVMVLEHNALFGREYVKFLAANSEGKCEMGYMELWEFEIVICGKLVWTITPPKLSSE